MKGSTAMSKNKPEQRKGKCRICRVAYRWPAKTMRFRDAYCPACGQKLQATTYQLRWKWITIPRPATVLEATAIRNERGLKT